MPKLTILFDLDGVIIDLVTYWNKKYNELYNDNLSIEDMFSTWDIEDAIKPEARGEIYNMVDDAEEYAALDPIPGALDGMQQLHDSGNFNIYIVSAFMGKGGVADGKCRWINKHLPFIHRNNIILAHDKELVVGDIFIDDSEKNLLKWAEKQLPINDYISPILMEAPHNKDFDMASPKYSTIDVRVSGWPDLLEYLNNIVG